MRYILLVIIPLLSTFCFPEKEREVLKGATSPSCEGLTPKIEYGEDEKGLFFNVTIDHPDCCQKEFFLRNVVVFEVNSKKVMWETSYDFTYSGNYGKIYYGNLKCFFSKDNECFKVLPKKLTRKKKYRVEVVIPCSTRYGKLEFIY